jgi:uncharacterized protein
MEAKQKIIDYSLKHYKLVTVVMVVITLALGALIPLVKVDTDPENMLSADEPVRIVHNQDKERFDLSDMVVLGIVNEKHPQGVFNVGSLTRIWELTEFAKTDLLWPDKKDPNRSIGVIEVDLMTPSTVDHISQGSSPGEVRFEWLMSKPPATEDEALTIRERAMANPMLVDTLISGDGKALCLYLPLTSKDLSHDVYKALRNKIATFQGDEEYHITGLPVAEDTFGVEMFTQMAVAAPMAMLVIFLLMLFFFRKLVLVISPMIVAMVSIICTMGLMIGMGLPVHIMSSMIPIFLAPYSVVDCVHILSEFFDRYTKEKGRRKTIMEVMTSLFVPMLYTSLTTAAGFGSLALTPIPPVQVFGIFVAIGVLIAWVLTILFVPAYVMFIPERMLQNFGHAAHFTDKSSELTRLLEKAGHFTYTQARGIITIFIVLIAIAVYGVSQIQVNDNPVKWFSKQHPIRSADIALNKHFGGTYMAYLVLEDSSDPQVTNSYVNEVRSRMLEMIDDIAPDFPGARNTVTDVNSVLSERVPDKTTKTDFLKKMTDYCIAQADAASGEMEDVWYEMENFFALEMERLKIFKQPVALRYIDGLQRHITTTDVVGKTSSIVDIVKKVHKELTDGLAINYRIPDSSLTVAECLLQYQSSHRPQDLAHFADSDYSAANIWVQLTSGDNKDMEMAVRDVDDYIKKNPPPVPMAFHWSGLTYINTVWQDKMVMGMLQSFLGSFLIVFIMMAILFRSLLWGIICMIPLSITILMIYGIIGLVGKDYDMPVAVLSALTLGMAVDFAIHFLERTRIVQAEFGSWAKAAPVMFAEPARAISRNVIVIAVGFLPLLLAPLIPYKTVGLLMCMIMALSGIVTLVILPAIIRLFESRLFPRGVVTPVSARCNCAFCFVISLASVILVLLNVYQFGKMSFNNFMWFSIVTIPVMGLICGVLSRRQACRAGGTKKGNTPDTSAR